MTEAEFDQAFEDFDLDQLASLMMQNKLWLVAAKLIPDTV